MSLGEWQGESTCIRVEEEAAAAKGLTGCCCCAAAAAAAAAVDDSIILSSRGGDSGDVEGAAQSHLGEEVVEAALGVRHDAQPEAGSAEAGQRHRQVRARR